MRVLTTEREEEQVVMFFENENYLSRQRSNDEFLRRMNGDQFFRKASADEIQTMLRSDVPGRNERPQTSCDGTPNTSQTPPEIDHAGYRMPSLAMVYSPMQAWQGILSPEEGLHHGSIFSELVKPFEVAPLCSDHNKKKEGGCCK